MKMRLRVAQLLLVAPLIVVVALQSSYAETLAKAPEAAQLQGEVPPNTGFVPPPLDLSHLKGDRIPEGIETLALPTRWDWREQGKVTSVKDQGNCGSCYAFASLANIESKMLIDGAGSFDFSENNAKECNWYGTSCSGGNYHKMASWFAKKGIVLESCDPYVPVDTICESGCPYMKTLLDWRIISGSSVPTTGVLQNYIYTSGPVYTSLYAGDGNDPTWWSEFSNYDGSYTLYYDGSWTPNHAVLIVGWDDSLTHAGGMGGWIAKNSWDTTWGGPCGYGLEAGYFTIAYGSANMGMYSSYVHGWQDYDQNGEVLYYDEGGWTSNWGYTDVTAWGLCKFVPSATTYLSRVEFWTNDVTNDVDIYVYDDFDGSSLSNLLASKVNLSYGEAGYYSATLDSPPQIAGGNDVYAVVKFTNSSYQYPVVADDQGPNETGTTYISADGSDGSWYDLGSGQGEDVAVRIRTSTYSGLDSENQLESPGAFILRQNYPNPFNLRTTIQYRLPVTSDVTIRIYDLLGREVEILFNKEQEAGRHQIEWNPNEMPSGIYFYKVQAGEFIDLKKMLLLK